MFKLYQILFLFLFIESVCGESIGNYQFFTGACDGNFIAIRKFQKESETQYLLVDVENLSTKIANAKDARCSPGPWHLLRNRYAKSNYFRGLAETEMNSDPLQDAGITHFRPTQRGVDLTVDLCPSRLPLDRIVFSDLWNELGKEECPVPIAISVTGIWMKEHPEDLSWLIQLIKEGKIAVEWVNHTYNHRFNRNLPLKKNFLLEAGTDLNFEILQTEVAMIEKGLIPSVFLRFPGLVSDRTLFQKIIQFGLIPIGSDAWLAKRQSPRQGSIILIHANGNEEIGIQDFLSLLKSERTKILSKQWLLYDLRESLLEEENYR